VLASYLWRQWENGEVSLVAAVGMAMVAGMAIITLIAARVGLLSRRASLGATG